MPTEAEWEYAARAGNASARYGNLDAVAWYADNSGKQFIDSAEIMHADSANFAKRLHENGDGPHAVRLKQPNSWNLYDMLGNVLQWTADWFDAGYYSRSAPQDPLGPLSGTLRVLRGGSWFKPPWDARASFRFVYAPEKSGSDIGVRCAGE